MLTSSMWKTAPRAEVSSAEVGVTPNEVDRLVGLMAGGVGGAVACWMCSELAESVDATTSSLTPTTCARGTQDVNKVWRSGDQPFRARRRSEMLPPWKRLQLPRRRLRVSSRRAIVATGSVKASSTA